MFEWFKKLLSKENRNNKRAEQLENLRSSFRTKNQSFQRLLAANNKTLKLMTEIEMALEGEHPAGMAFVRSRSTRIATNVFQIIRYLDNIAPRKYEPLFKQFDKIQAHIGALLNVQTEIQDLPLVVPLSKANLALSDLVGGKMAALGELGAVKGVKIPEGFVITARAYRMFVEQSGIQSEINGIIQSLEKELDTRQHEISSKIAKLIMNAGLLAELENEIIDNYRRLKGYRENNFTVAMRSSAIGEDSHEMSFAGQYRSILNVREVGLIDAYKQVVAGKYSAQAMSYRLHYGVRDDEVAMCVGCMPMVEADFGGVVYTNNPLNDKDDSVNIFSVQGLPQTVVDGSAEVDTFVVSREEPLNVIST